MMMMMMMMMVMMIMMIVIYDDKTHLSERCQHSIIDISCFRPRFCSNDDDDDGDGDDDNKVQYAGADQAVQCLPEHRPHVTAQPAAIPCLRDRGSEAELRGLGF